MIQRMYADVYGSEAIGIDLLNKIEFEGYLDGMIGKAKKINTDKGNDNLEIMLRMKRYMERFTHILASYHVQGKLLKVQEKQILSLEKDLIELNKNNKELTKKISEITKF